MKGSDRTAVEPGTWPGTSHAAHFTIPQALVVLVPSGTSDAA